LKKKLVYAYDCNKEKVFELENQDIFGENENDKYLTKHSIIQPTFFNNCFTYYFYVFGKENLNVYHFDNLKLIYDFSLTYPSNFPLNPIKII